jgi:hypothetical protein
LLTVARPRWRSLVPGAIAGGVALVVVQTAGTGISTSVSKGASDTYGTFALVIGLLTWLALLAPGRVVRGRDQRGGGPASLAPHHGPDDPMNKDCGTSEVPHRRHCTPVEPAMTPDTGRPLRTYAVYV